MSDEHPIDRDLRAWATDRAGSTPTPDGARLLIATADLRARTRRTQRWVAIAGAAALLLTLLVGAGLAAALWPEGSAGVAVHLVEAEGSGQLAGRHLAVAEEGRVVAALGADRIALDVQSEVELTSTTTARIELRLDRGTVAAEVAPRAPGQVFAVRSDDVLVTVIGTVFGVARTPEATTVTVDEGTVHVEREAREWQVRAGQQLVLATDGEAVLSALSLRPPSALFAPEPIPDAPALAPVATPAPSAPIRPRPVAVPSVDKVREARAQLLAGDIAAAETLLVAHLEAHPEDAAAWSLLGSARRKSGDADGALDAWRAVIAHGGPSEVERARFEAAALLQTAGSHEAAIVELQALLATPTAAGALEPEVRLRLGRSLLATGRDAEGRAQLEHLQAHFPGTAAADAAGTLLSVP